MSKYEVPTLLENMGTIITDVANETAYILQVYVPCGYEPETVAKHIKDRTGIICYVRNFIGLEPMAANILGDYVYIQVSPSANYRLPAIRKQISEALLEEYGKAGSDVKDFLRAISACPAGCKFALQYDSMWAVWNAMIDQELWSYFGYVVNQILNADLKDKLKPFKLVNIERIRNMKAFYSQSIVLGIETPTKVFTATYLKAINPFTPPEIEHEN